MNKAKTGGLIMGAQTEMANAKVQQATSNIIKTVKKASSYNPSRSALYRPMQMYILTY